MAKERMNKPSMPELLREREAVKLAAFFGKTVEVPRAPQLLWKTLEVLKAKRINIFSPHYLPAVNFEQDSEYPGWRERPHEWFWEQIETGEISKDSVVLPGVWVLFDHTLYGRDPFERMLRDLLERRYRREEFPSLKEHDPRLNVSAADLEGLVYPEIKKRLGLSEAKVEIRSPRAIEFNFLGNLHYPELGETPGSVWLEDRHLSGSRLISGSARRGGLAGIDWRLPNQRYDVVGFRPMIVFSS